MPPTDPALTLAPLEYLRGEAPFSEQGQWNYVIDYVLGNMGMDPEDDLPRPPPPPPPQPAWPIMNYIDALAAEDVEHSGAWEVACGALAQWLTSGPFGT